MEDRSPLITASKLGLTKIDWVQAYYNCGPKRSIIDLDEALQVLSVHVPGERRGVIPMARYSVYLGAHHPVGTWIVIHSGDVDGPKERIMVSDALRWPLIERTFQIDVETKERRLLAAWERQS